MTEKTAEFYDIKILKDGTWLYGGTPITRLNMVKLFASVLKKDDNADYWLETPYEKGRITVEDVPFTAVEVQIKESEQTLLFRTNLDEWIAAGPEHKLRVSMEQNTKTPLPYIHVRNGLEARIARPVYYELAKIAVENEKGIYGVWSQKEFYPIDSL
jgi:hypothetical protein